jgi:hypothetical protein
MEPHIIVEKPVSQAIGRCRLTRNGLLRLLHRIHSDLPGRAAVLRQYRDPQDTDCFRYQVVFSDAGKLHTFRFRVNDVRATGFLFVEECSHDAA